MENTFNSYKELYFFDKMKAWENYLKDYNQDEQYKIMNFEAIPLDDKHLDSHIDRIKELNLSLTNSYCDILTPEEKKYIMIMNEKKFYDTFKKDIKQIGLMPRADIFRLAINKLDGSVSKSEIERIVNKFLFEEFNR